MALMVVGQDDGYKNGDVKFMHNTSGETTCDMYYDGKWFTGHAKCLPEDMDMWSERTGSTLAEIKANIKRLKYMRAQTRQEMKPLTLFESRLKCCKGYNHNSVEARKLRKEIWLYKDKIQEITNAINDEEAYLKRYITEKDNLYVKIRAKRSN